MTGTKAVNVENFIRAETDTYLAGFVKNGALGTFLHSRDPASIDGQEVVRMNRDTLYSMAVFDLDAGEVTITLPDAGPRYMAMQVIDQDHYTHGVEHAPARRVLRKADIGTRYVLTILRTLVDPEDQTDVHQVHALQDGVLISQVGRGSFEAPDWDEEGLTTVRDALKVLRAGLKEIDHAFGTKEEVDPIRHLLGTASGWGGNPDTEAAYLGVYPEHNDGKTVYRLTVKDVPVDGFWSISIYNADGFFERNSRNAYAINSVTAKKDVDGSVTVQFGGCNDGVPNCLPTPAGWNYSVRLYRPRSEIREGKWTFPPPQPVA